MAHLTAVVAQSPDEEASAATAELVRHLEQQVEDFAATEDERELLTSDKMALATDEIAQAKEQQADNTASQDRDAVLTSFRIGYRQSAASTAEKTLAAGATATQTILQMAGWVQEMKSRLSRKEFSRFVKDLLQWVGDEARKYLDIARAFGDFDFSRLGGLEPFTILKLRTKKFAPVVARLKDEVRITQQRVQELIESVLPKKTRKLHPPVSGSKALLQKHVNTADGTFYFTLKEANLDVSIGAWLEKEFQSKSLGQVLSSAMQQQDYTEQLLAMRERIEAEVQQQARSRFEMVEFGLKQEIAQLKAQLQATINSAKVVEPTTTATVPDQAETSLPIEETITISQSVQASLPAGSATQRQPEPCSDSTSQPTAPWQQLLRLRDAEAHLQVVDSQIQALGDKLARAGLDRQAERDLRDTLTSRQNLRSRKISQIVSLADSNNIPADYESLRVKGRVVFPREYASSLLGQAQTWSEVVVSVGQERTQLLAAVKDWSLEQRQVLVQLLSAHLQTEANPLENIEWIPKNLLDKALSSLSFKLRKIGGPNNLMDEPEVVYIPDCKFVSLDQLGTRNERWMLRDTNNKLYPVFGRDEIEVDRINQEAHSLELNSLGV